LEHGYLFFGDERAYTVMQAKDADKGGRSTIGKMPYSLNLAISPCDGRPPGSSGKSQLKAFAWFVRKKKISMLLH